MKINYIIATWSGVRVKPDNEDYYVNVLKNHINHLNTIKNDITQITIMKPINDFNNSYYDIEYASIIKFIECENQFQSYGQWLFGMKLLINEFDYFILVEDDYVPATPNFDKKLVNIYNEGTYLCSMATGVGHTRHSAISNGIMSSKTISKIINSVDYVNWLNIYGNENKELVFNGDNYQRAFSRYLIENNVMIVDYIEKYNVDYYSNGRIINYSPNGMEFNEKIFTPIQNIYK
jgi:hypothetical protein